MNAEQWACPSKVFTTIYETQVYLAIAPFPDEVSIVLNRAKSKKKILLTYKRCSKRMERNSIIHDILCFPNIVLASLLCRWLHNRE